MTTSENFPVGKLSRSLKGAFVLIEEGGVDEAKVGRHTLHTSRASPLVQVGQGS